ncbi:MAG: GxGYxYP family putative glycoside hydrolase [Armatimonadota bacterium]|nr:GxGYxYP family putative glycoside hydrolase [Armatimonadota bacterium]
MLYTYDLTYTLKMNRNNSNERRRIWDEAHFVSSIQGIVNREKPRLYLYFIGDEDGNIDRFWLNKLRERGEWLADHTIEEIKNLRTLIELFRDDISGLVVYDENVAATSNVASTIAGVENLACIRFDASQDSLYYWLALDPTGPKLPVKVRLLNENGSSIFTGEGTIPGSNTPSTGSAKCDAYIWAKENYIDTGRCNPAKMGYYIDQYWLRKPEGYIPNHTLSNHDYFIANRGFFFDLSPWDDETPVDDINQPLGADMRTLQAILRSAWEQLCGEKMIHIGGFVPWDKKYTTVNMNGKHDAVPSEWRFVEIITCFNGYIDADALGIGCMANASVFQHYPLDELYPQKLPNICDLKARGLIDEFGKVAPKTYITIYVGDYDSAAWLYQKLPQFWNDQARGSIPLGWAFNPNLADRFAPGMAWARKTKTANDFFVAGDSGAGYINPGHLMEPRVFSCLPSGIKTWTEHCKKYYRHWDISATGFIIDGYAPAMSEEILEAYKTFSPNGIVAQKIGRWGVHKGMPFIRMGMDLEWEPVESAKKILQQVGKSKPEFFIFRTILWRPTAHKKLFDALKASPHGKDIEIVDPYTLFLLLRQHEEN